MESTMGPSYQYRATILRVVDGDTVEATISLGFDVAKVKYPFRLFGLNAPELMPKQPPKDPIKLAAWIETPGFKAKKYLANKLGFTENMAHEFVLNAVGGNEVVIQSIKDGLDKYGRYLAKIWVMQVTSVVGTDGKPVMNARWVCVNDQILADGIAVPMAD